MSDPKPIQQWIADATKRYLTDPDFHARVRFACALTEHTAVALSGSPLTQGQRHGILQAATYGCLLAELDVSETGYTADETVQNMRATSEALGMQLIAQPLALAEPDGTV